MSVSKPALGRWLLWLFVLSGFAGLVYQSVWSHYLGLVLGHAAYAQSLVLAIYMGGMALGSWLVSRAGVRWRRLILAYALVECAIGLLGLLFHGLFVAYTDFSQDVVLARLHSEGLATLWQWSSAALLIAPQSVLLGMTFPLMSAGYLRVAPGEDGAILGGLYFSNSIGAAFGALVCTFVLLPWIGMPGAVQAAGAINILVALLAAALARSIDDPAYRFPAAASPDRAGPDRASTNRADRLVLAAAFVTGATSFVYEIGWVRLLNQALGTTVHSFELMLAAFIFGLAFGGLWVRRRSARVLDAVAATGHAQVWMGIAALLSLPLFAQSFRWVGWLIGELQRNDAGYTVFSIGSAAIALLVMFPAAFFAGMTLPLLTMALLRRGRGEASIGRVYAANTLGAIVGVFLTLHALIPLIGVRLAVTLAAVGDLALGLLLLRFAAQKPRRVAFAVSGTVAAAALVASLQLGRPDPAAQVSGVFRTGNSSLSNAKIFYLRDGKTATVSLFAYRSGTAVIATNGKPDAGLQMRLDLPPSSDEVTMRMAAALPLAIHPSPKRIAVIGWGSGMTTDTFLRSSIPETVDTVEIEPAMYDAARLFGPHVQRAYTDPRSHPRFEDARAYFATGNRRYDVIFSEPSNPWVSGVANLFTEQFYRFLAPHLAKGGVLVQWIHCYEIDDRLLATIIAALIEVYPNVDAYLTNTSDLLLVASEQPLPSVDMRRIGSPDLARELRRNGFENSADFAVRRIGSRATLQAFVRMTHAPPHSDFYPTVSLDGPRARFVRAESTLLQLLVYNGMPVLDVLGQRRPPGATEHVADAKESLLSQRFLRARAVADAIARGDSTSLRQRMPLLVDQVRVLLQAGDAHGEDPAAWFVAVGDLAGNSLGLLSPEELDGVWIRPGWAGDPQRLPEAQRVVLAALDAGARRDVTRMRPTALAALDRLDPRLPGPLREEMLVLAMLGSIGERDFAAVPALETRYGRDIAPSPAYGPIRNYLLAWADVQSHP